MWFYWIENRIELEAFRLSILIVKAILKELSVEMFDTWIKPGCNVIYKGRNIISLKPICDNLEKGTLIVSIFRCI